MPQFVNKMQSHSHIVQCVRVHVYMCVCTHAHVTLQGCRVTESVCANMDACITLHMCLHPYVPSGHVTSRDPIFHGLSFRFEQVTPEVNIVLVGKYTKLSDSYLSLIKSLRHSALAIRRKLSLKVP